MEHAQKLYDILVRVFDEVLGRQGKMNAVPGHPVHCQPTQMPLLFASVFPDIDTMRPIERPGRYVSFELVV